MLISMRLTIKDIRMGHYYILTARNAGWKNPKNNTKNITLKNTEKAGVST